MSRYKFIIGISLLMLLIGSLMPVDIYAAFSPDSKAAIPRDINTYQDKQAPLESVWATLKSRMREDPFSLIATLIFFCAVVHTLFAGKFMAIAHRLDKQHRKQIIIDGRTAEQKPYASAKDDVSFAATLFHFLGEVEAIFGLWLVPLIIAIFYYYDWTTVLDYFNSVRYAEPLFVVVIMSIASTRPVLKLAEKCLRFLASLGQQRPSAWWLTILLIAPIFGSFITEPAAMTIAALLLGKQFYKFQPSRKLQYGTLGLLFVNVSIGGTLTEFAAPPVLMVAMTWNWDFVYMFTHFGWKAMIGIVISTFSYYLVFRRDFKILDSNASEQQASSHATAGRQREEPIPFWVYGVHLFFLCWTVLTLEDPPLFLGGFLFFLAFIEATAHHQMRIRIREPLLVGFFLAALVTHGGLQRWWIDPVLSSLGELPLFLGATVLTAFNDNAAITYLASLVPEFSTNVALQHAVVAGALSGGGLTVIANAPNPAGQSLLSRYFSERISPLGLLLGAIYPTIIAGCCFMLLPG